MSDAIISEPATKLRELFTTILIFCQPSDPLELWNKFRDALCEDILNRMRNENQDMTLAYNDDIYNDGLIIIEDKIHEISDKSLTDFGLPAAKRNNSLLDPLEVALRKPYNLNDLNEYITENEPRLVNDQVTTYNCVMKSVSFNEGKIFFLDAPGGTGKTFITNLILAKVRSLGKLALAVASSGIAATLLAGGRTAHSTFKLPLTVSLEKDSVLYTQKWTFGKSFTRRVKVGNIEELITKVYPDISQIENKDHQWMCQRAILAARNSNVDEINDIILSKLPGDIVTYTSIDTVMDQEDVVNYPQEFLNSLNPSGLPPTFS
ncbi:hypothetical protein EVAR_45075_1 [Eumeta japonica]|uniref:ATP-dependent DNA helicase n=1 Tax=Eumeta variegata TaxID=151549 RepID=A0A4C1XTJ7_EUMVA|nr:hypothetical protein EVAR_45075_1 [Eumeta japonica]